MKKFLLSVSICILACTQASFSAYTAAEYPTPLDSIRLSDPFVLADSVTNMYYMTGTGGKLWKSPDLKNWAGPFSVVETDPNLWMGANPQIWAAEIHPHNGKYYYFATFTNPVIKIDDGNGVVLDRRACHILVADTPEGPYRPVSDMNYLPENKSTLDATLWYDTDGQPYMIYCHEWIQNNDGTVERIALTPDFSTTTGESRILFRASDSPWSREVVDGKLGPNRVTDGPYLFRTDTGRLGMIWTSWIYNVYTQGVAYSIGGLDGPWIQQPDPITPPDFGHGMIFTDFNGRKLLSCHSHKEVNGHYIRIPHFFEIDLSTDKLKII